MLSSSSGRAGTGEPARLALAEAISFTLGVGENDPDRAATYVVEQLALRGFIVQPIISTTVADLTPETLKRVRLALGLTRGRLAQEASIAPATVRSAESGRAKQRTLRRIANTLVRLGAKWAD